VTKDNAVHIFIHLFFGGDFIEFIQRFIVLSQAGKSKKKVVFKSLIYNLFFIRFIIYYL